VNPTIDRNCRTASRKPGAGALCLCALVSLASSAGCGTLSAQGQNAEGVRLHQQGYYQQSLTRFQQAVYSDPNNADGYYNLAATYHRMGKLSGNRAELDQAESYYNQCLDHGPDHRECYRGLAILLVEENRSEEAFRLLEGWAGRSPSNAEPKIELARLYEEFGDKTAAEHQLVEALTSDPYNARALAALGKLHEQAGEFTQALSVYQRSLWHDRLQPEVAARVAALQSAVGPQPMVTPSTPTNSTLQRY
jgi:tetratricopeptide (TPR) repeat protein